GWVEELRYLARLIASLSHKTESKDTIVRKSEESKRGNGHNERGQRGVSAVCFPPSARRFFRTGRDDDTKNGDHDRDRSSLCNTQTRRLGPGTVCRVRRAGRYGDSG